MKNYTWHKQSTSPDVEFIECPVHDPIKDFHRDPTGAYVLIRCDAAGPFIEVAVCDKKHTIMKIFRGRRAGDIYQSIFEYEEKYKHKWFSRKDHAAYLGKELKKAELALLGTESYIQE